MEGRQRCDIGLATEILASRQIILLRLVSYHGIKSCDFSLLINEHMSRYFTDPVVTASARWMICEVP